MQDSRAKFLATWLLFLSTFAAVPAFATGRSMQKVTVEQGWAVDKGGLFWTQDNGAHWKNISPPNEEGMIDVFFLDASHGWVLLEGYRKTPGGNTELVFHVAATSDCGANWTTALVGTRPQIPDELSGDGWLDFADSQHGYIVLRRRTSSAFSMGWLLATDDGGRTWKQLEDPPLAERPSFATATDGWLAGGAGGDQLWVTRTGGKTWEQEEVPAPKSAGRATRPSFGRPDFKDAKHGFLSVIFSPEGPSRETEPSALVLFVTDDAGRSWREDRVLPNLRNDGVVLPSITVVAESALMVAPFFDLRHLTLLTITGDGRVRKFETEVAPDDANVREVSFATSTNGWILTNNYRILSTTDGGATWRWLEPSKEPRELPAPPPPTQLTPLKRLGPGPALPPPGYPPQLRNQPPPAPPPLSPQLYVAPHLGFDQQRVNTLSNMQTWFDWSPFFDVGFYVGGANYCYQTVNKVCTARLDPNLTATWIAGVSAQGWGLMPIWVGPQAPCNTGKVVLIDATKSAAAQGSAEADKASAAMNLLGLAGTVVFYDMENYAARTGSACSQTVQAFLGGWVSEMNKDGFPTTAVYGNPLPAQLDFSQVAGLSQVWISVTPVKESPPKPGGPPSVTIWGLGSGGGALSDNLWPLNQRAHQFLIDIAGVAYGQFKSLNPTDYDIVDLQLPGGNGHKAYAFPNPTETTYVGPVNTIMAGINDIGMIDNYGTPFFITGRNRARSWVGGTQTVTA